MSREPMQDSLLVDGIGPLVVKALEQLVQAHKAEMAQFISSRDSLAETISGRTASPARNPTSAGMSLARTPAAPRTPRSYPSPWCDKAIPAISPRDLPTFAVAPPMNKYQSDAAPINKYQSVASAYVSGVSSLGFTDCSGGAYARMQASSTAEAQAAKNKCRNRQSLGVTQSLRPGSLRSSNASVASSTPGAVQLGMAHDTFDQNDPDWVSEGSGATPAWALATNTNTMVSAIPEHPAAPLNSTKSMLSKSTSRLTFREKISAQIELEGAEVAEEEESAKTYEAIIRGDKLVVGMPDDVFARCVQHMAFETTFIALIVLNTLTIIAEVQYGGIDIGYNLQHPSSPASAADTWPGVQETLSIAENIFGALFTVEVFVKVSALRRGFFTSGWNLFDAAIVLLWLVARALQMFSVHTIGDNPTVLRFCRLMRVMRVIRLFRWIQSLDSLHILIKSIQASMSMIVWAFLLLGIMITMSALAATHFAMPFLEDDSQSLQQRLEVYRYFGTFTRSAVSMFEVTLGNFGPVMRSLTENIDESWGIFFVVYKAVGGFSVVSVITGVFLHETFGVADSDPALMVITARRNQASHLKKMTLLFNAADRTGLGALSFPDFVKLMADPFVKTWLSAYELNVFDVALLFDLVDDGDGCLTAEELLTGIARLKGAARSLDLHELMQDIEGLTKTIDDISTVLIPLEPQNVG